jgi:thiamine biosynthesis lipoprotein ApbE
MHADALATAISVLGSEAGLALIESEAGVEARVVTGKGRGWSATESAGFARIRVR